MADQTSVPKLHRRILIYSGVGMFFVGAVAAAIGIFPLFLQLREAKAKNLLVDLRAHISEVEQYVRRALNSALSANTRYRRIELRLSEDRPGIAPSFRRISTEVVQEWAGGSTNTVGIILLDPATNVIASAGPPCPPSLWVIPGEPAAEPMVRGPTLIGNEKYLVAGAALTNRVGLRVGTAIVLYRLMILQAMVADNRGLGRTGEMIIGDTENRELPVFFPLRQTQRSGTDPAKLEVIFSALELAKSSDDVALLDSEYAKAAGVVVAYGPVKIANWGVLLLMNRNEMFGDVNRLVLLVVGTLVFLIGAATFGMVRLLRPLSGRLLLHTDELESQIGEKTAALNSELEERRRVEKSLRDSEALYHSLVDTLPINILRKDYGGRITFGNRGYCEMMGKRLEDLRGKTDWDLFPRELAEKYVTDDRRTIESREVFEDIEEHVKSNGDKIYVHVLKAPVLNASGDVVGTQVIFWDVTARKVAEVALEKTAADLARSNRELELFAYVASHDLQEPLRMITSYTQLLARRYEDRLDEDAHTFIGYAVDGAHRMQRLINDLLAYSRVGTRAKPFEKIDCENILRATLSNLKVAIEECSAQVKHEPLPVVLGDGVQLLQLFQNLLGNALKFRSDRPPELGVEAAKVHDRGCEEWVFRFRDNGIGIDAQYFDRIFVIFQRLHTQQEYPGTGIGLAICKKIVERHGGRIWVESKAGEGSVFCFTLPVEGVPIGEGSVDI